MYSIHIKLGDAKASIALETFIEAEEMFLSLHPDVTSCDLIDDLTSQILAYSENGKILYFSEDVIKHR